MANELEYYPIRIGISSCLLGQKVRYNGDHKWNQFVVEVLGNYFKWLPICPEVEIGLGVPRDTLRLVLGPDKSDPPRLIVTKTGEDLTDRMESYAQNRISDIDPLSIHGYIFKKGSPSCGVERVSIYRGNHMDNKKGRGVFAEKLVQLYPLLPVEEEGRLSDLTLRRNWVERVFAYYRLTQLKRINPSEQDIIHFHTCHKMQLLSHSRILYKELGQLVAQVGRKNKEELLDIYGSIFMKALSIHTTRKKHADVMYHLLGFLKKKITVLDKKELVEKIEKYRLSECPLVVPITLLNHHFLHHPIPWIKQQTYLEPFPQEMLIRD